MQPVVVVADDEVPIAELIAAVLEEVGYQVHLARDGHEALHLVEQVDPDLVISDLQMPLMDGLALRATLRQSHPELPLLLMSASEPYYWRATGADAALAKPFSLDELLTLVMQFVPQPAFALA